MRQKTRSEILSELIARQIIDPVLAPFDQRTITLGYLDWFATLRAKSHNRPHTQTSNLWTAAQSERFQANRLSTQTHDPVVNYWAIELARFCVPPGHIGYVTQIEQVVNDMEGSYYPTNVVYWGSPRFVLDDVDNLRWYLTLSYFDGTLPPRFNRSSAVLISPHALPGAPYTDLAEIDAIWYPAHNSKKLKLLVPGARVLRFFMISPPTTTYQWEVSGRLSGYTQSTYQAAAVANAREIV